MFGSGLRLASDLTSTAFLRVSGSTEFEAGEQARNSGLRLSRVVVQKGRAPKQSHGRGHLTIRRLGNPRREP